MKTGRGILMEAISLAEKGKTVLVVAPDEERKAVLMRGFLELALARGAGPVPWDDRTVRVGDAFCSFFAPETIAFVLERKYWYGARSKERACPDGAAPRILWDRDARERAADAARTFPDGSVDRSHLLFGKASERDDG